MITTGHSNFTLHQDYSERKLRDTGTPSNTLEESFEYTALSFADIAELENRDSVDVAKEYYEKIGEREYTSDVMVYLAEELIEQVRIVELADTYQYLQDRWLLQKIPRIKRNSQSYGSMKAKLKCTWIK